MTRMNKTPSIAVRIEIYEELCEVVHVMSGVHDEFEQIFLCFVCQAVSELRMHTYLWMLSVPLVYVSMF